jgi:hypothetical protein
LTAQHALGVAVAVRYAYQANDADGLRIYDISNPAKPGRIGHASNGEMAKSVTVVGRYAYVANGNAGLRIYDVANPAIPVDVGHINDGGQARAVAFEGNNGFLANLDDGVRVYNSSNPTNLAGIGHINTGGSAWGLAVAGGYVYVAAGFDGLRIYRARTTPPIITRIALQTGSPCRVQTSGTPGVSYTLQASPDLGNWINVATVIAGMNGLCEFSDSATNNCRARLYRLRSTFP